MTIYLDMDDVLTETAQAFCGLVKEMFGVEMPFENMQFFDLKKTFGLTDEQYEAMMIAGHTPEALLALEEVPGASETINRWIDAGHAVIVVTGRPAMAYEASRQWLNEHGLERATLYCLDKYGRDAFIKNREFTLKMEDYRKMHFDFAAEDSPMAFSVVPNCPVAVHDRPWNRDAAFPDARFRRCFGWGDIEAMFADIAENKG